MDESSSQLEPTEDLSSDVVQEETDPSTIIVIHPGSKYLRIGLASDSMPKRMLHAIARKRKSSLPCHCRTDPFLVPKAKLNEDRLSFVTDVCQRVAQMLQTSFRSDGRKRFTDKRVASLNATANKFEKVLLEERSESYLPRRNWLETNEDVVIGDEILYLNPELKYNVAFPIQRGDVNLSQAVGGSPTAIMADLEQIWSHAIESLLQIKISDLPKYRAVLVIPAIFQRSILKNYMSILLLNLGFSKAFVLQDHVAATFGAGLGYACVVDVGDQKTSISCVEDGISHSETRIHLDYGGGDITQVFHDILQKVNFPYKGCDPLFSRWDAELLSHLKEKNCHLDFDICGLAEQEVFACLPGETMAKRYTFYLSDECLLAPMALFYTDLFEITAININDSSKRTRFHTKNQGDPEDPHDQIYLAETSRKYTKAGENSSGEAATGDNEQTQTLDDDLDLGNEEANLGGGSFALNANLSMGSDDVLLLPLDVAIKKSIESCSSDELKKKMYSCVLVVGGGLRMKGLVKFLSQRLGSLMPPQYRPDSTEIILDPKDMSSENTAWKGAAILSSLESARELWIRNDEWQKLGQRILREKAPFPWS